MPAGVPKDLSTQTFEFENKAISITSQALKKLTSDLNFKKKQLVISCALHMWSKIWKFNNNL